MQENLEFGGSFENTLEKLTNRKMYNDLDSNFNNKIIFINIGTHQLTFKSSEKVTSSRS